MGCTPGTPLIFPQPTNRSLPCHPLPPYHESLWAWERGSPGGHSWEGFLEAQLCGASGGLIPSCPLPTEGP